jgi:hypothetical protein
MVRSPKQLEALKLLGSGIQNVMLDGGSRSGKTTSIVDKQLATAYLYPGARQLIGRHKENAVRASIWRETLPAALAKYPKETYTLNHTDMFVSFFNGSELYCVGFDNEERVEKIFGREFCTIYFNEASQIPYDIIIKAKTRLAQRVTDKQGNVFKNRTFYDLNPPAPTHWAHKQFIEKKDPTTGKPLAHPERYAHLMMNPADAPWLSSDYIETLKEMPDRARRRFLLGEWVKPEGAIFDAWTFQEFHITELPKIEYFVVGIDHSGTRFAAVLIGFAGEMVYLLDEIGMYRSTIMDLDRACQYKWHQYNYQGYGDPSQPTYNGQMWNVMPADNAVDPGINLLLEKIEKRQLWMFMYPDGSPGCPQLLAELDSYRRDEKGRIVKENDDFCDGMRYGVFTHVRYGGSILADAVLATK